MGISRSIRGRRTSDPVDLLSILLVVSLWGKRMWLLWLLWWLLLLGLELLLVFLGLQRRQFAIVLLLLNGSEESVGFEILGIVFRDILGLHALEFL